MLKGELFLLSKSVLPRQSTWTIYIDGGLSQRSCPLSLMFSKVNTYHQYHHDNVPLVFSSELTTTCIYGKNVVGDTYSSYREILQQGSCKMYSTWVSKNLGIPIKPTMGKCVFYTNYAFVERQIKHRQSTYTSLFAQIVLRREAFDVDTVLRFLQYNGLALLSILCNPLFHS